MENNLEVWKKSHALTLSIYLLTKQFPVDEKFGLTSQIRRSAASVPANIIEGQSRQHPNEFRQFLFIAKGSLAETHYHLYLAKCLSYLDEQKYADIEQQIINIKMMLNKLIQVIGKTATKQVVSNRQQPKIESDFGDMKTKNEIRNASSD